MPRSLLTRAFAAATLSLTLSTGLTGIATASPASPSPSPSGPAGGGSSGGGPTTPLPGYAKADDGAAVTSIKWLDSTTFDITVKSPAVGAVEPVRIIVPKGWRTKTRSTYPVLYAFHGGNDTYVSWTRSTDIKETAHGWNALVVMPDGGQHGSYTDWFNYGRHGSPNWDVFHTRELIQLVQRDFHGSTARAAMGLSSGAQGAITYAARHPHLYRYAASYSGILHMTMPGVPAIMMATGLLAKGNDPFAAWGIPGTSDGNANWAAHDPYNFAGNLRGTGLFISSGTTGLPGPLDPPWGTVSPQDYVNDIVLGGTAELITGMTSQAMVARLRQLKIPVTVDFYGNAWHQWAYWNREYKKAWPLLMKAIGAHRT